MATMGMEVHVVGKDCRREVVVRQAAKMVDRRVSGWYLSSRICCQGGFEDLGGVVVVNGFSILDRI